MFPRLLALLAVPFLAGTGVSFAADLTPVATDSDAVAPVPWRPFGVAAFEEAARQGKPVFLLLTAPWTWDHFLLPGRVFADDEVRRALAEHAVPVRADASVYPELRRIWSIRSGLLPSVHFLDSTGAPLASFPPLGEEELLFYLGEYASPDAEMISTSRQRDCISLTRTLKDSGIPGPGTFSPLTTPRRIISG